MDFRLHSVAVDTPVDNLSCQIPGVCRPEPSSNSRDQSLLSHVEHATVIVLHHDHGERMLVVDNHGMLASSRNACVTQPAADAKHAVDELRVQ